MTDTPARRRRAGAARRRATPSRTRSRARRRPPARPRIAVALSGGRDSMALLDALALLAPELGLALSAVHVHHGLSPNADALGRVLRGPNARGAACRSPCTARASSARPGASLEAAARAARYAALATADADVVALAHHADDQAETLLLQLLRGAGPHGLAAMPADARCRRGSDAAAPVPRAAARGDRRLRAQPAALAWIDDESNANTGVKRNFIRHEVAPRLAAAFPGYPATLARAAAHQAEAARLIDELALLDAQRRDRSRTPRRHDARPRRADRARRRARRTARAICCAGSCASTASARRRRRASRRCSTSSCTRRPMRASGSPTPAPRSASIADASSSTRRPSPRSPSPGTARRCSRCRTGRSNSHRAPARASPARRSSAGSVTVRTRAGGERIRLAGDRPRQALKRLLQDAGMPPWQRESLPLVFCGDALAAVPGHRRRRRVPGRRRARPAAACTGTRRPRKLMRINGEPPTGYPAPSGRGSMESAGSFVHVGQAPDDGRGAQDSRRSPAAGKLTEDAVAGLILAARGTREDQAAARIDDGSGFTP